MIDCDLWLWFYLGVTNDYSIMNHTLSGAIAVGAPKSAARYDEEAKHAVENSYNLLLLTEEGQDLLSRFARSVGSDWSKIPDDQKSGWIKSEYKALHSFLVGVSFLFSKI